MSFPNLFISSLKVIRPKEYGVIVLTLMGAAFVSNSKASIIDASSLNEGIFSEASKSKSFSLLSSVSSSLVEFSQDSTTRFDVEIMRRQKPRELFSSCLVAHFEPPCKVTTVFSSTSLANTVDLEGKYKSRLREKLMNQPLKESITEPDHYVKGRSIEPLDVIESWKLMHHVACALKYICRAGRKECEKADLEKAIFYLDRFLRNGTSARSDCYMNKRKISVEKVAQDWRLNTSLELAIMHLHSATLSTSPFYIEEAKKAINVRLKQLKLIAQQNAANENSKSLAKGKKK